MQSSRVSAISFFDKRVVKSERDRVSFSMLHPKIHSNKSFKLLKADTRVR